MCSLPLLCAILNNGNCPLSLVAWGFEAVVYQLKPWMMGQFFDFDVGGGVVRQELTFVEWMSYAGIDAAKQFWATYLWDKGPKLPNGEAHLYLKPKYANLPLFQEVPDWNKHGQTMSDADAWAKYTTTHPITGAAILDWGAIIKVGMNRYKGEVREIMGWWTRQAGPPKGSRNEFHKQTAVWDGQAEVMQKLEIATP